MIISSNGTFEDSESAIGSIEEFLEMMEEDEEIKLSISLGQVSREKFTVSSALDRIENVLEENKDILKEFDSYRDVANVKETLEYIDHELSERERGNRY